MKRFFGQRRLIQGEMIRPWYGVAWHDYAQGRNGWVCYPIGINLVAIFLRWIWLSVQNPYWRQRPFSTRLVSRAPNEFEISRHVHRLGLDRFVKSEERGR